MNDDVQYEIDKEIYPKPFHLEKARTTGKPAQPSIWQTFIKDIAPDIHDAEAQNAILMHFCEQGWELVNVQGRYAYFKRPSPEWIAWKEAEDKRFYSKKARR